MLKLLRIIAGSLLAALLLHAASLAVQDCPSGATSFDNCLWLRLRQRLDLPQTKLGRVLVLEFVGLGLLAGLYLTVRFVFPFAKRRPPAQPSENVNPNAEI